MICHVCNDNNDSDDDHGDIKIHNNFHNYDKSFTTPTVQNVFLSLIELILKT